MRVAAERGPARRPEETSGRYGHGMKSVDIVCPVYREEEVIGAFHRALRETADGLDASYEIRILYVIDPAPDRTEEIVRDICRADRGASAIVMSRRFGHQAALAAGIDASGADAI